MAHQNQKVWNVLETVLSHLKAETEVYFPRRPHDTFHPLIWELKRRSAWKYVSSVEALGA